MFNIFKSKKPELTVVLDRPDGMYAPGQTIGVTVDISPNKDMKLNGAWVGLTCQEHYEYQTIRYVTDSDGNEKEETDTQWGYNELFSDKQDFLEQTTLPAETSQRYTFQMALPADAVPSCKGKILRMLWSVGVKLDRRLAGDVYEEAELAVQSLAPGLNAQAGEYGESNDPNDAQLALILMGTEAVADQTLSGQLRISPLKDFSGKVRLELVCTESVHYDRGQYRQTVFPTPLCENIEFVAGQQQDIPFQVTVPADALPSVQTPHGSVSWTLKGILDRHLRQDTRVEQEISVYSAG